MRESACGEARSVARGSGWPPSARSVYRRAYRPIHRRRGRVSWRGRVAGRLPLDLGAVSYTHLRAHETKANLVCRLLLEKKKTKKKKKKKRKQNKKQTKTIYTKKNNK